MLKKIIAGLLCFGLSMAPQFSVMAEETAAHAEKADRIAINIPARSLAVYQDGKRIRLYPIGVGKAYTPTPVGYYKILEKIENPTWTDPVTLQSIPSGEDCPLGYRWMQIKGNYGIHGTNRPASIGGYVSNGCIRMFENDVEGLYKITDIGTPVDITYNRVVVEKTDDGVIAYYIYPDGYGRQPLEVNEVAKWISGYGVDMFEPDDAIEAKIEASDGQPTYIARPYPLYVNGERMKRNAVEKDGHVYIPCDTVADALGIKVTYNPTSGQLTSVIGSAKAQTKKGVAFIYSNDLSPLFGVTGRLGNQKFVINGNSGSENLNVNKADSSIDTESAKNAFDAAGGVTLGRSGE